MNKILSLFIFFILFSSHIFASDYFIKGQTVHSEDGKRVIVTGLVDSLDFSQQFPNMETLVFRNIIGEYEHSENTATENRDYKTLADLQALFQNSEDDLGLSRNANLVNVEIAMEGVAPLLAKSHLPNILSLKLFFYNNLEEFISLQGTLTNMPGLLSIDMNTWPSTGFLEEAAKLPNLTNMKFSYPFGFVAYTPTQQDISLYQSMTSLKTLTFGFTYADTTYDWEKRIQQRKVFNEMQTYLLSVKISMTIFQRNLNDY